jgi:transposase
MLAEQVDHVIGVDTHRDSNTAAILNPAGALQAQTTLATDAFGYRRLFAFARKHAPGRRCWAIEGTGSFGAGLTSFLLEHGEWAAQRSHSARRVVHMRMKSQGFARAFLRGC